MLIFTFSQSVFAVSVVIQSCFDVSVHITTDESEKGKEIVRVDLGQFKFLMSF